MLKSLGVQPSNISGLLKRSGHILSAVASAFYSGTLILGYLRSIMPNRLVADASLGVFKSVMHENSRNVVITYMAGAR